MTIVNRLWMMSLQAGVLILVVLLARIILKKYSKIYTYCLWILVGFRLLCPIFIETPFSLQPDYARFSNAVQEQMKTGGIKDIYDTLQEELTDTAKNMGEFIKPDSTRNDFSGTQNIWQQGLEGQNEEGKKADDINTALDMSEKNKAISDKFIKMAAAIYVVGIGIVLGFCLLQYFMMKHRISTAVHDEGNVWLCESVSSPFVMGTVNQKIILPYSLSEKEKQHILKHERMHIKHFDPFVRTVGLVCLCLHWWNPLVWIAVHKMNQDMEMYCDEAALKNSTIEERKSYARTLLSFAERQSGFFIGLAFGESNTERRVKNIMNKRKGNVFTVSAIAVLVIFCIAAFMTIPKKDGKNKGTADNEEQTTTINSQDESEDIGVQLGVIAENIELWRVEYEDIIGQVSYAVTDLDRNGRFEVVVSDMGGTGSYSYSRFYEVNEQHDGLAECETDFIEGSSQPDIIVGNTDVYYDAAKNIFYYIEKDFIKLSATEYNTYISAICLDDGKLITTAISNMIETYPEYKVVYKNAAGGEITEEEHKMLVEQRFKNCDRYVAGFGWQDMSEIETATEKEAMVNLLLQSYKKFGFNAFKEEKTS